MAFVGQTRSRRLIQELSSLGIGECTQRGELPPRRTPWFFDNGAYRDFTAGCSFNEATYRHDLSSLTTLPDPSFLVVPDVVAGGLRSLDFSLSWVPKLIGLAPLYLVVQDGL